MANKQKLDSVKIHRKWLQLLQTFPEQIFCILLIWSELLIEIQCLIAKKLVKIFHYDYCFLYQKWLINMRPLPLVVRKWRFLLSHDRLGSFFLVSAFAESPLLFCQLFCSTNLFQMDLIRWIQPCINFHPCKKVWYHESLAASSLSSAHWTQISHFHTCTNIWYFESLTASSCSFAKSPLCSANYLQLELGPLGSNTEFLSL